MMLRNERVQKCFGCEGVPCRGIGCRAHAPPIHATLRCYSLAVQRRKNGHQARYARQRFTSCLIRHFPIFLLHLLIYILTLTSISNEYAINFAFSLITSTFSFIRVLCTKRSQNDQTNLRPDRTIPSRAELSGQRRPYPSPPGKVRICTCLLSFFDFMSRPNAVGAKFPRGQILRNAERAMLRNALSYGKIILIFLVTLSLLSRTQKRVAIGIQVRTSIEIVQQLIFLFQKIYL